MRTCSLLMAFVVFQNSLFLGYLAQSTAHGYSLMLQLPQHKLARNNLAASVYTRVLFLFTLYYIYFD